MPSTCQPAPLPNPRTVIQRRDPPPGTEAVQLLRRLLQMQVIRTRDWRELPNRAYEEICRLRTREELLTTVVGQGLITPYQASRIESGQIFGLVLGNYRILDRLGSGGMGVVYRADHLRLPREVAVKVLAVSGDMDPFLLERFYIEMDAAARLRHPNLITAFDAGELPSPPPSEVTLHYFVMEYYPGKDLDVIVREMGRLPVPAACQYAYQIASALEEAHRQGLIHRDVKPANVLITDQDRAMLLDFGLVRMPYSRVTQPGYMVGSVDYLAPEQAIDAHEVDIRADVYGLGASLFWALTGHPPFVPGSSTEEELRARQTATPPSIRDWHLDLPEELERVVRRMMEPEATNRYSDMKAVMGALYPFQSMEAPRPRVREAVPTPSDSGVAKPRRVLIVDDDEGVRNLCRVVLEGEGLLCECVDDGREALDRLLNREYDLALIDCQLPHVSGGDVARVIREAGRLPQLKVILFSGRIPSDELAASLDLIADDFMTKPISVAQLRGRVRAALRMKDSQERAAALTRDLIALNQELERSLSASGAEVEDLRGAMARALSELAAHRHSLPVNRLARLPLYCRALANAASGMSAFAGQFDPKFIQTLECCAPLIDIGELALPDQLLLKPGQLNREERAILQSHTDLGAELVRRAAGRHTTQTLFFRTAVEMIRHHHERWDGAGYPDRLKGEQIPLAARVVAIADAYDEHRTRRVHKPPLSHAIAIQLIRTSEGRFDPGLVDALEWCEADFLRTFQTYPG